MTKLWRTIEESPLLMDVKDVWRERLGMEFEPLSRFLDATKIFATRLPGRTPWSSFKVVENDDSFVAFCESTGESKEVLRSDVICNQLKSRQLAAELNAALKLARQESPSLFPRQLIARASVEAGLHVTAHCERLDHQCTKSNWPLSAISTG